MPEPNGWTAQHGVLVSSRRKPADSVPRLQLPSAVRRRRVDWIEVCIATVIISGLLASLLLALAAVFGAAWLAVSAVRELLRALGA